MSYDTFNNGLSSNNNGSLNGNGNGNGHSSSTSSSTYQNVIHKKQEGTLILNDTSYTFYPIKTDANGGSIKGPMKQSWLQVIKHQVSPASHARHLLKMIVEKQQQQQSQQQPGKSLSKGKASTTSAMFEFKSREDVERIRKDISNRLITTRKIQALNNGTNSSQLHHQQHPYHTSSSRKRNHDEMNQNLSGTNYDDATTTSANTSQANSSSQSNHSYEILTKSQFKVASSSLLASYPTLRKQHTLLLNHSTDDTPILPDDQHFWSTHSTQLSNQLAKITGVTSRGLPSTIKSSLDIQISTNVSGSTSKKSKDSKSSSSSTPNPGNAIVLGVEEMKQIFLMYPAVHATYVEKVPLELSEELFWRKYLESEYFHRDRGKLGMSARTHLLEASGAANASGNGTGNANNGDDEEDDNDDDDNKVGGGGNDKDDNDLNNKSGGNERKDEQKKVDESIRVATASSNDIFSRKELELQRLRKQRRLMEQEQQLHMQQQPQSHDSMLNSFLSPSDQYSNKRIAIGQFDLTSTANTERGSKLLLHDNADVHPSNDCGKKVIEKYNKHWAMVLNSNDAVAGCDVSTLARKSVNVALDGDNDANIMGGIDQEMKRLVKSASAAAAAATFTAHHHTTGNSDDENDSIAGDDHYYYGDNVLFEELKLKNINAYSGQTSSSGGSSVEKQQVERDNLYFKRALNQVKNLVSQTSFNNERVNAALPDEKFGKQVLTALTRKLVEDSKTEKDTARMTNELPQEFRKTFAEYYRRSSELLRHFYALRRLMEIEQKGKNGFNDVGSDNKSKQSSKKLDRIVTGLVGVYQEMEEMRKKQPSTELGEKMRKMFITVMDQLHWASQLHKDGLASNNGPKKSGGFEFVDVTD